MKSKIVGNNYNIYDDGWTESVKLNRKKTDKTLDSIIKSLNIIKNTLVDLESSNEDWHRLQRLVDDCGVCDIYKIRDTVNNLENLRSQLVSGDDEIPTKDDLTTLYTVGFRPDMGFNDHWIKEISYDGVTEVFDEVVFVKDREPVYRECTINWKQTPCGRSSTDISYKKKKIGKLLKCAIYNTMKTVR